MEILVATVIAVVAVIALAYMFGTGRGLVDHYAAARLALGAAHRRMELLGTLPASDPQLQIGYANTQDVVLEGRTAAWETWRVVGVHDPADPMGGASLKRVWVSVRWGSQPADTIGLQRLFPVQ